MVKCYGLYELQSGVEAGVGTVATPFVATSISLNNPSEPTLDWANRVQATNVPAKGVAPIYWDIYAPMFDTYRVRAVKIRYIPINTQNPTWPTYTYNTADPDDNWVVQNPLFMTWMDWDNRRGFLDDDIQAAQPLHYDNCKVRSLVKPWKMYIKAPKKTPMPVASNQIATAGERGVYGTFSDTQHPPNCGFVFLRSFNSDDFTYPTRFVPGYLKITYYIKFYNRVYTSEEADTGMEMITKTTTNPEITSTADAGTGDI